MEGGCFSALGGPLLPLGRELAAGGGTKGGLGLALMAPPPLFWDLAPSPETKGDGSLPARRNLDPKLSESTRKEVGAKGEAVTGGPGLNDRGGAPKSLPLSETLIG